jgi:hypothetical protein
LDQTWVIGSKVLQNYYTVFDMTSEQGKISMGIGLVNTTFDPFGDNSGGGGGPIPDK